MESLALHHIQEAMERVHAHLPFTPLEQSYHLSQAGRNVYCKLECNQPTAHSFKIRGVLNKLSILGKETCAHGVGAISSGNHGVATCYGAKLLGYAAPEIVIPKNTAQTKVDWIRFLGGTALLMGETFDDAHRLGEDYFSQGGKVLIDAYYEDRDVYAGQGTMMLEILAQNPDIDTVVVPIGGGGLIGGIAVAAKATNPNIRVIGVQTAACPAMVNSLRDGVCYTEHATQDSLCTALIGGVGPRGYEICKDLVDDIIVVTEAEMMQALRHSILNEHHLIEPSSAVVLAAELFHRERVGGENVALVLSGGNIDQDLIQEVVKG